MIAMPSQHACIANKYTQCYSLDRKAGGNLELRITIGDAPQECCGRCWQETVFPPSWRHCSICSGAVIEFGIAPDSQGAAE